MKISVTDRQGSGIMLQLAKAIGATVDGRFVRIPPNRGEGYMTGFTWGGELRMLLRNYQLHEPLLVDRTNELPEGQENIIFFLNGIFTATGDASQTAITEQAIVFICMQAVSSVMELPSNTLFRSVTIAARRDYLQQLFGHINHPVVASILQARNNFAFETAVSTEMVQAAADMVHPRVPDAIEDHYYRLKCEELLCYIFAQLTQRETIPTHGVHVEDIKTIYSIKDRLHTHPGTPPDIKALAKQAGMSEPKMRKLFKQTFGKGIFEYYQHIRMQEAARLLRDKRLSVSEVGYELGFTNLSHFSRVFEEHLGMKPKKYSRC